MTAHDPDAATAIAGLVRPFTRDDCAWWDLVWQFDRTMEFAIHQASEPMLAQIRFAWWREQLSGDGAGARDPMLLALRERPERREALVQIVDGWEAWAVRDREDDANPAAALLELAQLRGGGLFAALLPAGDDVSAAKSAGARWALWDAGERLAGLDKERLADAARQLPVAGGRMLAKPLRILSALADHDLARNKTAPLRMTFRLYLRFWRALLFAR